MQRILIAIIFVLLFSSCDFFSSKKLAAKKAALSMDTIIDFSTIDTYPMFLSCEGLDSKQKQEDCFGNELVSKIDELILSEKIIASNENYDTVFVDLLIEKDNRVRIAGIHSSELIKSKIPNLDSVLIASIHKLPYLTQPAIKRGIPVNAQFKLPILIKVKD